MELPNINKQEPVQLLKWINPKLTDKNIQQIESYVLDESMKLVAYELATQQKIDFELN